MQSGSGGFYFHSISFYRLSLAESRNLSRTNICNHEAGEMYATWRVEIVAIVSGYPCLNTQGLIQRKSAHRLWESFLTNKFAKQWWPNIIIKESKQNLHFLSFSFYYGHIMLLICSKKMYSTFFCHFLFNMFTLCCWFAQKTGIVFNGSFSFT